MSAPRHTLLGMASRSNVSAGITIAQLDGRARYLLNHKVPRDVALADLATIGATPDLVGEAIAAARRAADANHVTAPQHRVVADLLDGLLPDQ